MESAYLKLEKVLANVPMQSPRFPVISNVTGEEVKTPEEIRETLRDQVTGTVRWIDCMQRLIDLGCDFFIELGPGNVLAGLLKRTNREIAVISIGDAESLASATRYFRDPNAPGGRVPPCTTGGSSSPRPMLSSPEARS